MVTVNDDQQLEIYFFAKSIIQQFPTAMEQAINNHTFG